MSNGSIEHYDDEIDKKRLYERALNKADNITENTSERLTYWLKIQRIFKKDISTNQTIQDWRFLFQD